ncbi:hypothetical protein MTQ01_11425 [Streptomyces sp. XM4193]|uniref:hypothetical protein n=1 Tax=Streptomyces sp. XM4193 TaxID=2929782 RepID=UPI001FFB7BDF|nr:hypothetical protein [Streptomyces sp. XM4193]MCK1796612.1 hypothetical protein [Streptomyces sp. XM4193]
MVGERSAHAPGEADIDTTRRGRGTVAILTSAALLVGVGSACSAADHLTSAMKVKQAVEKLGERDSVSVTARFDATEEQILAYLQEGEGPGKGGNARRHARLLADLELAAAVSAGMPLRDVAKNDRFDNAAALNFGGNDVFALKSVDRKLYTRVNLAALAREVGDDGPMAGRAGELEELARQLPGSLATARSALRGEWVRVSPNEFGEIGRALGGGGDGAVESSDRIAQATALLREPALQQQVVSAVEKALGKRARFASAGKREGAEHITLTLNAKDAAHELGKALAPVRAQLGDPDLDMLERAPDKDVRVGLAIRHERLSTLTVDVGQFDRGRSGALPLKLTFAAGEVVSVAAPVDAKLLAPHDLLEALAYAASRHPELSTLR